AVLRRRRRAADAVGDDVGAAGVTARVAAGALLAGAREAGAVVARVAHAVRVAVLLIRVLHRQAVVAPVRHAVLVGRHLHRVANAVVVGVRVAVRIARAGLVSVPPVVDVEHAVVVVVVVGLARIGRVLVGLAVAVRVGQAVVVAED